MRNRLVVALFVSAMPLLGAAAPPIQVKDLGDLGGVPYPVHVTGFGRNGTLVGVTHKVGVGDVPFAWTTDGGFRVISEMPGIPMAANGLGHVVGTLGQQGFLWSPPNTLLMLSLPTANNVVPQAVNDAGQVAGMMELAGGERRAFRWTLSGGFKDLGDLGGADLTVTDISETGHVVGHADDVNGETRAFLSKNGVKVKNLGTLGGNLSQATAVNDAGTVVGYARTADFNLHGFVYRNNTMTALASPTPESAAYGINASGMVVGSGIAFGAPSAMVWSPSGVATTIEGADYAVGLNDAGTVALYGDTATGLSTKAYLWTAAGGLLTPDGAEHDASSQALGVTADGALVSLRLDWADVQKAFYWKPGMSRHFLDGLGGGHARALAINASGKIAGFSRTKQGYDRAFVWTPSSTGEGVMTEIPAPAGWHSTPVAINASGAVAGTTHRLRSHLYIAGPSFYWSGTGTAFSDLGQAYAVDLNNVGQVVAYASPTSFVWKAGVVTPLPTLGEGSVVPYDINNKGQVVGRFNVDAWTIHPYSWKPGTSPADLGTLGGSFAEAVAVNDNGQIVGNSDLPDGAGSHAFRTSVGKPLTDLGSVFDGGSSTATAMNKNGAVAGNASFDGSMYNAFLYDTRLRDLGELADSNGGALDINDLKDVVGWRLAGEFYTPAAFASIGGAPLADLPSLGGEISRAFAVNAAGVAVGDCLTSDGQQRAVLWRLR